MFYFLSVGFMGRGRIPAAFVIPPLSSFRRFRHSAAFVIPPLSSFRRFRHSAAFVIPPFRHSALSSFRPFVIPPLSVIPTAFVIPTKVGI
ncbi:hypothetical protein [Neisseria meningitidis]|uniref:hypothetical protein n=1 Tax=Neisseria meningitidis TaxID=487 RepID=UPI000E58870B|nr:hypothetical protein [Neisseria meningitidis]